VTSRAVSPITPIGKPTPVLSHPQGQGNETKTVTIGRIGRRREKVAQRSEERRQCRHGWVKKTLGIELAKMSTICASVQERTGCEGRGHHRNSMQPRRGQRASAGEVIA